MPLYHTHPTRDHPFNPYWKELDNLNKPPTTSHSEFQKQRNTEHYLCKVEDFYSQEETLKETLREDEFAIKRTSGNTTKEWLKPGANHVTEVSNVTNQVLVPPDSGVTVIFPKGCSPLVKYQIKCKVANFTLVFIYLPPANEVAGR